MKFVPQDIKKKRLEDKNVKTFKEAAIISGTYTFLRRSQTRYNSKNSET